MRRSIALALLAGLSVGAATPPPTGYIASFPRALVDTLMPAPAVDDARDEADRSVFRSTRRWAGTPRWDIAKADVAMDASYILHSYGCAAGVRLDPATMPRTVALLDRAGRDMADFNAMAKNIYRRPRPFLRDEGPICQPRQALADSFDYPSGHTGWGWISAYILADLLPAERDAILLRARVYGESRIICGAHSASAVEAGQQSAAIVYSYLERDGAFRHDLERARSEFGRAARGTPSCAIEPGYPGMVYRP